MWLWALFSPSVPCSVFVHVCVSGVFTQVFFVKNDKNEQPFVTDTSKNSILKKNMAETC